MARKTDTHMPMRVHLGCLCRGSTGNAKAGSAASSPVPVNCVTLKARQLVLIERLWRRASDAFKGLPTGPLKAPYAVLKGP